MINPENYLDCLLKQVPEFISVHQQHLEAHQEVLGHVLFGELYRFTETAYQAGQIEVVTRLMNFINEAALSENEYILELVQLSFLAYLRRGTSFEYLKSQLNEPALTMYQAEIGEAVVN